MKNERAVNRSHINNAHHLVLGNLDMLRTPRPDVQLCRLYFTSWC